MIDEIKDIELLKLSLKMDDYDGDDKLLNLLWDSAAEEVVSSTYRTYDELKEMGGGQFPNRLLNAIMWIATYDYEHRDGTGNRDNFMSRISSLVKPYRKLS